MGKRITPAMMAEAMSVPVQAIRIGLQQGKLNFGAALQQSADKYTYVIFPEKAREVVGADKLREWGF